jgi:hypothetical protein
VSTKAKIIAAIQYVVDNLSPADNQLRIALGEPGDHVKNVINETEPTGQGWEEPGTFPVVIEGIADTLGAKFREVTGDTEILPTDRVLELVADNITVDLPTPSANLIGLYIVKTMGQSGCNLDGDLDGGSGLFPCPAWSARRIYCNGTGWFTW